MKVFVKAKPRAKSARVERLDEAHFMIAVKEPPTEGRANAAVAEALARTLRVASSRVRLVAGAASRKKIFEVS